MSKMNTSPIFVSTVQSVDTILCYSYFLDRRRLNKFVKNFYELGESPTEKRGRSRQTEEHRRIRASMVDHTSKFKVTESHYGRAKSKRQYLQCDFSLKKMFNMWLQEQTDVGVGQKQRTIIKTVKRRKNRNLTTLQD